MSRRCFLQPMKSAWQMPWPSMAGRSMRTAETRNLLHCSPRLLDALNNKVHQHPGRDFSGALLTKLIRSMSGLAKAQDLDDVDSWLTELAFADWNASRIQTLLLE